MCCAQNHCGRDADDVQPPTYPTTRRWPGNPPPTKSGTRLETRPAGTRARPAGTRVASLRVSTPVNWNGVDTLLPAGARVGLPTLSHLSERELALPERRVAPRVHAGQLELLMHQRTLVQRVRRVCRSTSVLAGFEHSDDMLHRMQGQIPIVSPVGNRVVALQVDGRTLRKCVIGQLNAPSADRRDAKMLEQIGMDLERRNDISFSSPLL